MARDEPLKLLARDPEDMDVFAALLQDALVPLTDVTYQKREKRFVLVANRFKWHADMPAAAPPPPEREGDARFEDGEAEPPYERVNCGLCIERVQNVRYKDMRPTAKDEILNLLTIKAEPRVITLLFSGGGAIRLEVSAIRARLEDLGEAWPTRWRPSHDEAEAEPGAAAAGRDEG
jgi:hypothetical protein